jgi:hypothetical protein
VPGPSKPCKLCPREKTRRSSTYCYWHWLIRQPIELQIEHARWRLANHRGEARPRVPKKEWPDGAGRAPHRPPTVALWSARMA